MSVKTLSLDEILAAGMESGRKVELVDVPELGGAVYIRQMHAGERDDFDASMTTEDGKPNAKNWRARFVASIICDASGNLLLGIDKAEAVGQWADAVVSKLYAAGRKFSHLDAGESAKGKDDSGSAAGVLSL